jgi:hypothetical protein
MWPTVPASIQSRNSTGSFARLLETRRLAFVRRRVGHQAPVKTPPRTPQFLRTESQRLRSFLPGKQLRFSAGVVVVTNNGVSRQRIAWIRS